MDDGEDPRPPTGDDWNELSAQVRGQERIVYPDAPDARGALQWLIDDMHDAGETRNTIGRKGDVIEYAIHDSVVCAARALVNLGGSLDWFTPEESARYDRDGRLKNGGIPRS